MVAVVVVLHIDVWVEVTEQTHMPKSRLSLSFTVSTSRIGDETFLMALLIAFQLLSGILSNPNFESINQFSCRMLT